MTLMNGVVEAAGRQVYLPTAQIIDATATAGNFRASSLCDGPAALSHYIREFQSPVKRHYVLKGSDGIE